jgi:hypothetical protein
LQDVWTELSHETRAILILNAEEQAAKEEWD